jgi:ribonuclease P protein component
MNGRLERSERLRKKSDYLKVLRSRKCEGKLLAVYQSKNDSQNIRFGFITGKKVSKKAVERNRLRRLLKEFSRRNKDLFPCGNDYVFRALPGANNASYNEICDEARRLLEKIAS